MDLWMNLLAAAVICHQTSCPVSTIYIGCVWIRMMDLSY